jgi:hypothetical protein
MNCYVPSPEFDPLWRRYARFIGQCLATLAFAGCCGVGIVGAIALLDLMIGGNP